MKIFTVGQIVYSNVSCLLFKIQILIKNFESHLQMFVDENKLVVVVGLKTEKL